MSSTVALCQKCKKISAGMRLFLQVAHGQSMAFTLVLQKHTFVPHEKKPNKFVTLYRDVHGPTLYEEETAREFVYALNNTERASLMLELQKFNAPLENGTAVEPPSSVQLRLVVLHQALPFIGFGFLDNFLMIVAGEYIDVTLGAMLGISTMAGTSDVNLHYCMMGKALFMSCGLIFLCAAAGLGNLISDVAGVGSAYYVESFVAKLGVRTPHLTPQQVDMKWTRWASSLGKSIGVTIGCLLGMFPLLFFKNKRDHEKEADKDTKITKTSEEPEQK